MSLRPPMSRGSGGAHYSNRSRSLRRHDRRRRAALVAVVVVVLAAAAALRAATEAAPVLRATRVLHLTASMPGTPPPPAWPAAGQAAFVVPGVVAEDSPGQHPAQIASAAKVMTAYVVLHDHPVTTGSTGFTYTVTAADVADYRARVAQAESVVPVVVGEHLDEVQLLQGLLIPSGNNFADILASMDAGGAPAFVARMNSDAKALAMSSTTYTDPSGFDATTTSTAHDQAVLAGAVMADPLFASIVASKSVTLPQAGKVANFDTLVGTDGFVGIKTGSDATAGGCFVFAATRPAGATTVTVYGAVLGQDVGTHSTTALIAAAQTASAHLVDAVTPGITSATVVPAGTVVATVTDGAGHRVEAVTTAAVTRVGWAGSTVAVTVDLDRLGTTLARGARVGSVSVGGSPPVEVVAGSTMPPVGLRHRLEHLL